MRFFHTQKRGYTLIEITIVIALLGILASVVLANVSEARKKGRDSQRISDIQQLSVALRLVADFNSGYPAYTSGDVIGDASGLETSSSVSLSSYVPTTIKDPSHNGTYQYVYDSEYNCGGTLHVVLYAKTMERSGAGNWATVCGTYSDGTSASTYGVILK